MPRGTAVRVAEIPNRLFLRRHQSRCKCCGSNPQPSNWSFACHFNQSWENAWFRWQRSPIARSQKTCRTVSPLIATCVMRCVLPSVTRYAVVSFMGPVAGSSLHLISPALRCSGYAGQSGLPL